MITIDHVSKSFRTRHFHEGKKVLDSISMEVHKGEVVGLIGDSGCGKTTLAMIAMGLLSPDHGRVLWDDNDIVDIDSRRFRGLRGRAQMVFQNPISSLNPQRTVRWSLDEAYRTFHKEGEYLDLVKEFNLPIDILGRKPGAVSGGELQRVSIIRALASDPDYLILDEPTSMLDLSVQASIMNALMEHKGRRGMLLITHDLELADCVCDRFYSIEDGRIAEPNGHMVSR